MNVFKITAGDVAGKSKPASKPRAARKPLLPVTVAWQWVSSPIWPSAAVPNGLPGLLLIGDEVYMVSGHVDVTAGKVLGFRLTKSDGTFHDIDAEWWTCDCPDATYRKRQCKHSSALVAALKQCLTPSEQDDARRFQDAQDGDVQDNADDYEQGLQDGASRWELADLDRANWRNMMGRGDGDPDAAA